MVKKTLLPCNSSELERAIDVTAAEQLDSIPHYVLSTANPNTVPAVLLPWLAWAWRVEVWDSSWSEEQKRAVIAASFEGHRRKGTIGAIKNGLAALGVSLKVVEWFQDTPKGQPYTFRISADPGDNALDAEFWKTVLAIVERTKNVRSHMTGIDVQKTSQGNTFYAAGAAFVIKHNIPAAPEMVDMAYQGAAAIYGIRVSI